MCKNEDRPFSEECNKEWFVFDDNTQSFNNDETVTIECNVEGIVQGFISNIYKESNTKLEAYNW